jgi:hypothetical protein
VNVLRDRAAAPNQPQLGPAPRMLLK